tara:strand:+ start:2541 stop:3128 length:588 start_codon:yes stop_codon:yes gene_type:complete
MELSFMKILYYLVPILIFMSFGYSFFFKDKKIDVSDFSKSIYDYSAINIDGDTVSMSDYKDKKILFVNVASKCGYTYQYKDLQELHEKYGDKVAVLGFPSNDFLYQEPGDNKKIKNFCSVNYGVTFPMFSKVKVKKKESQHPIYIWLSNNVLNSKVDNAPSWNFCKYLLDEKGEIIGYFNSKVNPMDEQITKHLK